MQTIPMACKTYISTNFTNLVFLLQIVRHHVKKGQENVRHRANSPPNC